MKFSLHSAFFFIGLIAVVIFALPLHAEDTWVKIQIELDGKKTPPISVRTVSIKADQEDLNSPSKGEGKFKTKRESAEATEDECYTDSGYVVAKAGSVFNGYNIGNNETTGRQNCGGFALARLLGGCYSFPTDQAAKMVKDIGDEISQNNLKSGDVVLWRSVEGIPNHFALVVEVKPREMLEKNIRSPGVIMIASKDNRERVRIGDLNRFPKEKNYGAPTFYRLDWDKIKSTRHFNLTGVWSDNGNFDITMTQTGNSIIGTYPTTNDTSPVKGSINGNEVNYTNKAGGMYKGTVADDGNTIEMHPNGCGAGLDHTLKRK